ncbi:hypothetical protein [Pyrococcus sp. NA2]|uniref:hypothetical protein n=1 Tax=Pyrococcus sp. (strain NA2) TaxID=342949 RepID=UPI001305321D|nr:hypothetical protein [Pyrococcus sp. NA2]
MPEEKEEHIYKRPIRINKHSKYYYITITDVVDRLGLKHRELLEYVIRKDFMVIAFYPIS